MRHGSLFSGIGGFDLAAEWMGWENVFHCEWNKFGQKILKHYWPNAISYGDITKTDFTIWRGRIDILTGGFPCQPYSLAGKRKGKEDDRHLWPEMLRAIQQIQPTFIVGENVPGLINWSKGLVFEEVQADLETSGYEVIPFILPVVGRGGVHRRRRIWFIAHSESARKHRINGNCRTEKTKNWEWTTQFNRNSKSGITPDTTSNAITGQDRESIEVKGTGITINEQIRGGQLPTVQSNGLDDISRGVTNTNNTGLQGGKNIGITEKSRKKQNKQFTGCVQSAWQNFPTQSPLCSRDDGFSSKLVGITFPKHRNESIKGYGNAIVPQVVYQIFKAIEEFALSENIS
jgi:DNA (cytosine-5)-methyltransferase 1